MFPFLLENHVYFGSMDVLSIYTIKDKGVKL